MQIELELLAPAKNKSIGIAAINCGADAVYIAGPKFGAREAASNEMSDIADLVVYAHKFGAKVYMVINTIIYDSELEQARQAAIDAYNIGCDALIVQDLALLKMDLPPIELFASTQTNLASVEQARFLESLGFTRLILARELSLDQISKIKEATSVPLESFVHGALCVSYSGQCYLSERVAGRSANRGCCAQACRSKYTLVDSNSNILSDTDGHSLIKDTPILSLKDLNLSSNIAQLVQAGITSFKIEGRLKNESYIKNVVLEYRHKIDEFIASNNNYCRASLGECVGGFKPNLMATFNRGYTDLFINGKRGKWRSKDGAKYLGEPIGKVIKSGINKFGQFNFSYQPSGNYKLSKTPVIANGDGLCFVTPKGEVLGARANACQGNFVATTEKLVVADNSKIFRNYNIAFEKELEKNMPQRLVNVNLTFRQEGKAYVIDAKVSNSIELHYSVNYCGDLAQNVSLAKESIKRQLGKNTGIFTFSVNTILSDEIPFFPVSVLNGIRRDIACQLEDLILKCMDEGRILSGRKFIERKESLKKIELDRDLSYLANCSNKLSRDLYNSLGAKMVSDAYELSHIGNVELMRTKYCIKYELGLCPNYKTRAADDKTYVNNLGKILFTEPLFLLNGKNKLELKFNCAQCQMLIIG